MKLAVAIEKVFPVEANTAFGATMFEVGSVNVLVPI